MRDNSGPRAFNGLRKGRRSSILPMFPYRVERTYPGRDFWLLPDGTRVPRRGPPGWGYAVYFGDETQLPRRGRVVAQGSAYSKQDASDHVDAYLRRQMMNRFRKARSRKTQGESAEDLSATSPVAGVHLSGNASASRATFASCDRTPGNGTSRARSCPTNGAGRGPGTVRGLERTAED